MGKFMFRSKGFTLIELLIVIAVIGVLAAVILVAIDPVEQLGRGRDAGRKSSVAQLGRALEAYFTVNGGYPSPAGPPTWNITITDSGEIKFFPTNPTLPVIPPCLLGGGVMVNNFCYKLDPAGPNIVVYTRMESKSETRKPGSPCATAPIPYDATWYIYSSLYGRSGIVCQVPEPAPAGPFTFF